MLLTIYVRDATNVYHNWTASYKHSGVKNVVKACLVCYVVFAHPSHILSIHNFKLMFSLWVTSESLSRH